MPDPTTSPTPFNVSPPGGATLAGEEEGAGRPLVLVHGLTATRRYVLQGSRMLARSGELRVIGYDARGHGESGPAPDDAYGYRELSADLAAVLDARGVERCVLAGSSMGAATAVALALAAPDRVEALIQITPAYDGAGRAGEAELARWDERAAALEAGDLDRFVTLTGANDLPERFRDAARRAVMQRMERHRHLDAVAAAVRQVPRSQAFAGLEQLERLEMPALVVASRDEADPEHPYALAREYARRLPRAELVSEVEGEPPLAWRGARLSRAIAAFLA